jgi:triacylglycerol lipase
MAVTFYSHEKRFNSSNMLFLAECADGAYNDSLSIQNWLTGRGLVVDNTRFHFDGVQSDNEYFIIATDDYIVLAFRGSELGVGDWKSNADVFKDRWVRASGSGRVHGGFEDGLAAVWDGLYANLQVLRKNNQPIWLTGHSRGGALAILAAAKLYHLDRAMSKAVRGIYTFGQPRMGNSTFAKFFNRNWSGRCYRVVNNNDIVTRFPPKGWGYRHVGKLAYFDGSHRLRLGQGKGRSRWQRMSDRIRGRFGGSIADILFDDVTSHFMFNYVKLCKKNVDRGRRRRG